ncbi:MULTISPECIES: type VI secretion system baseplate subunit TssE [Enterobacteriaceae]|uniref:type VI secretion system baseplate subunit TssE n=1 Tax=Enterobacteriaceae TaxID=543 RepID=UPI000272ADB0|nr:MULTISPECIES: GPW/gp25 family protein [Enterobacteriaceae]EJF32592.1 T6SS lysozyme-related protein Cts1D [Enterobacter sp. Ag1]NIF33025.1 type VI secretion system baseplate subunit TssE [Enterobacter sp. Cy-643]NIF48577.1 type VI secretion system baseplate subunit TssE [Enterobacter sp. Ap-1006]
MFSNNPSERKQQYLPTLLQRLQDDEPKSPHDRARLIDIKGMRSLVQKEIVDLINHTNIEDRLNEQQHKLIMASVLNYGVPALIGTQENHKNWSVIEKTIRNTILRFEPRIIPETLIVRSLQDKEGVARHAVIPFEIRGLIYWQPRPVDLCMSGRYDFESEKVDLKLL